MYRVHLLHVYIAYILTCRCTAFATDLDAPGSGRRTRELYDALLEEFAGDGAALWDNYGIDEDLVVSTPVYLHIQLLLIVRQRSHSLTTSLVRTYTK